MQARGQVGKVTRGHGEMQLPDTGCVGGIL